MILLLDLIAAGVALLSLLALCVGVAVAITGPPD